jgi:hypothetical protein
MQRNQLPGRGHGFAGGAQGFHSEVQDLADIAGKLH